MIREESALVRRARSALGVLILACLGAGIGVVAVGRTAVVDEDKGGLARLLADGDVGQLVQLIAPADRAELSSSRLREAWDAVTAAAGPFQRVVRTVVVDGNGARHELEVLAFEHGTGTLSALRTARGITELLLLAGTTLDSSAAAIARTYALQLTARDFAGLRAAFNQTMLTALPGTSLDAATRNALRRLRGPASVAAQITVSRPPYTVVETYLLFENGLRRVEISLDAGQRIAGLFLRPL
jgi:hypothetical protein